MFKFKHLPQYFLAFLLLVLLFLEGWTWYLGTANVTFERLIGNEPYHEISDLSLRRYKESAISPHLFTITTENEDKVIQKLSKDCGMKKVDFEKVPALVHEVDAEMLDVIKKSPYIYLSESYNLQNPKEGRMCLLFRDKLKLYLFVNGKL
jgi:hypothetical protein